MDENEIRSKVGGFIAYLADNGKDTTLARTLMDRQNLNPGTRDTVNRILQDEFARGQLFQAIRKDQNPDGATPSAKLETLIDRLPPEARLRNPAGTPAENMPRPSFPVGETARDEYAATQAEAGNNVMRPEGLQKPSGPSATPRPSFPVGEAAKDEYAAEQAAAASNIMRPEGLQKPSAAPNPADTAAENTPRPSAVTVSPAEQDANAARLRAEAENNPVDPNRPSSVDGQAVRSMGAVPAAPPAPPPAAEAPPPSPPAPLEISAEASAALDAFGAKIKDVLGFKEQMFASLLGGADISNGKQLQELVKKIKTGNDIDPGVRRQIIEGINDPARREPTLQHVLEMTEQDHNVLTRFNQNPGELLAVEQQLRALAPVAVAAASAPVNPFPDVQPPKDPLQASYYDPQWGPGSAAAVMPPSPPPEPGRVSSDPTTQDIHRPAAATIAAAVSAEKPDPQSGTPAAETTTPSDPPPVPVSEKTEKLRTEVGAAIDDMLSNPDAKALLIASVRDHDVALFVGRQIGMDLSDFGSESEAGKIDLLKIREKFLAMSDEELEATKQKIADGKKYLEENRLKVQAFNGMPEGAQHTLATGANALAGFQDKISEMGNNIMGGLMKNIGSIFSGGGIGNLFDGIDFGGMFKQIIGMVTGMIGSFSGSGTMKTLSNMGGQLTAGLTETIGAVTGQKPGDQIMYDVNGQRIDPAKAPVMAAAQQPQRPGQQQQPGQPQPGATTS